MKKCLFLILIMCMLLCACASKAEPTQVIVAELKTLEPFTKEETERMINVMSENRALIHGGRLYSFAFDGEFNSVLAVFDKNAEGGSPLAENCIPKSIAACEDRLYYINSAAGEAVEMIKLDASDRQTLIDKPCRWLQIFDGKLYYCSEDRLYSCAPDGSGETELIADCYYPFVFDGAILYQSGSDGERLHLRWNEDGEDYALSSAAAFAPIIVEDKIYHTGRDGIYRMNLNGSQVKLYQLPALHAEAEILPMGEGYIFRGITNDKGLYQWTVETESLDFNEAEYIGYKVCEYVGGGYRVDTHYYTDGRIRGFILTAPDGTETEYLRLETEEAQ